MARHELKPNYYDYRWLKEKYPNGIKFESNCVEGDYLNTDYTEYYVDGVQVGYKSHGNYS